MKATPLMFAAAMLAACSNHHARSMVEDACADTVGKLQPFDLNGCERNCTLIDGLEPAVSSAWMKQLLTECPPPGLDRFSISVLNNNPSGGLLADGSGVRWQATLEDPVSHTLAFLAFDHGRLLFAGTTVTSGASCVDAISIPDTRDLVPDAVEAFEREHGPRSWLRTIPPEGIVDASLLFATNCRFPDARAPIDSPVLTLYDSKDMPTSHATAYYGGMDSDGAFTAWCPRCDIDDDACDCFPVPQ